MVWIAKTRLNCVKYFRSSLISQACFRRWRQTPDAKQIAPGTGLGNNSGAVVMKVPKKLTRVVENNCGKALRKCFRSGRQNILEIFRGGRQSAPEIAQGRSAKSSAVGKMLRKHFRSGRQSAQRSAKCSGKNSEAVGKVLRK